MNQSPKRIFLVDDHTLVREWLGNLLRQEKDFLVVGQADSAPVALAEISTIRPDLAVIDLTLKNGSGLDLIKDIRSLSPDTLIVVLSMHEEIYYLERSFRAGARGYVTKRESTNSIVDAIRAVLAGRIYARPELLARLTERMVGQSSEKAARSVDLLSDREIEVFRRLGAGQPTRKIAAEMGLSMKTVQAYSARIKEKLGLTNASELLREAVRWVENQPAH